MATSRVERPRPSGRNHKHKRLILVWAGYERGRRLRGRVGGCHMWLPRVWNDRGQVAAIKKNNDFYWFGLGMSMGAVYMDG